MSFTFDPYAALAELRSNAVGAAKPANVATVEENQWSGSASVGDGVAKAAKLACLHSQLSHCSQTCSEHIVYENKRLSQVSQHSQHPAPDIEAWEERAAIREHDGGEDREIAEREAAREQGFANAAALLAAANLEAHP
ncbi:MAG: hypothetical protein AAGI03_05220 [Pseudomonadota bacterium]